MKPSKKGFVDTVRGKVQAIARVGAGRIMCSGRLMDIARYHYRNAPKWPLQKRLPEFETAAPAQARPQTEKTKEKPMTKEEIAPELLASIQAEARTAERARLEALDAMAGPGLTEIIAKAKTENKQPGDIALECLAVTKGNLALRRQRARWPGMPQLRADCQQVMRRRESRKRSRKPRVPDLLPQPFKLTKAPGTGQRRPERTLKT